MDGTRSPSGLVPLSALPLASLDLETTGLDVSRDRVIQVAVALLDGPVLLDTPRMDCLVRPDIAVPATAARITGLDDAALADAPGLEQVLPRLADLLAGRIVIGVHIAFDLAILRAEAERREMAWTDPPSLDIGMVLAALEPTLPHSGMEAVTGMLGVTVSRRHDALADAVAVAECYQCLLPRLSRAGVRTLAEARGLLERRRDLVHREFASGWHADAGPATIEPARLDGTVFARTLGDVMSAPPVWIAPGTGLADAARTMIERRIGSLLVGPGHGVPSGIITERDLLGGLVNRPPGAGIEEVMSAPVASLGQDELLYRALARMDRLGIRHLAVTDDEGLACGMVSHRDLLHHRAREQLAVRDATGMAATEQELATAYARVPEVAEGLLADGLDGRAIARVIGRELQAVTARMSDLACERMAARGRGGPPAGYAVLVLGSGGRAESLLGADQDNALVHEGEPADDDWFAEFGSILSEGLAEAGIRLCDGGVMASNPVWRGTVDQWRDRVAHWLSRARPEDLLSVDIFFDLAPVAGERSLGHRLRQDAVAAAAGTRPFLGLLAQSVTGTAPRLGFLGRLPVERGRVDLKRHGLLPLVSLVRALALRSGHDAASTAERLNAIEQAGRLGAADCAALLEFQNTCMTLVLRQQVEDMKNGAKPSNRVDLTGTPARVRRALKSGMNRVATIISDLPALMGR